MISHALGAPLKVLFAVYFALVAMIGFAVVTAAQVTADVGDQLSDPNVLQNWEIVLAFLLPILISILTSLKWSDAHKAIAAFAISAVMTIVGLYIRGELSADMDALATILKVFALTIPFYYGFWKPTGTTDAIHEKTG